MTTTESDLASIEEGALAHLVDEEGRVEADLDHAAALADLPGEAPARGVSLRLAIAVAMPTLATAVMVGGVFLGASPRVVAGIAGLLGIAVALVASRVNRPWQANAIVIGGLFAIGLLVIVPTGFNNVVHVQSLAAKAARSGDVLRPPVPLDPGWQAIVGWLMGLVGFGAAWVAIVVGRPALGLLLPMPVAAIAGISVPKGNTQIASGLAVLALFAIGLGLLSSGLQAAQTDERPPLAYELRRALRGLPLIAVITVALYFLAQANVLFPKPKIDPTQKPQRPRTVPLSKVRDRVLFTADDGSGNPPPITGPWRIGSLDVYDGHDWRLPPFADSKLKDVPRNGRVNTKLAPGVAVSFHVEGLGGSVLPGLPNIVAISLKSGPKLAYDSRNANIRVAQGAVAQGLEYTVVAAKLPSVDDLKTDASPLPGSVRQFTDIPPPPPAVAGLIDQAKTKFTDKWEQFDYLRTYILDNVTATGQGVPGPVPPEKVQDMVAGSKQASPFDMVAAQAMLARWIGVPSRIGYGFDNGDLVDNKIQVRPKNGATFVEVYFPDYEWLPVIGTPKKAKPTVGGSSGQQQYDASIQPSTDIAVQLFMPVVVAPSSVFVRQMQRIVSIGVPAILLLLMVYALYPAVRKSRLRSRRRQAALDAGPRARIALAYSEWRDLATDFGYPHRTDTPLMFLDRFGADDEHTELAWLVTRGLWGDLQNELTDDLASYAEELSRALRRRLAQAHPASVRFISAVSRLSLRDPFAADAESTAATRPTRKERSRVAIAST